MRYYSLLPFIFAIGFSGQALADNKYFSVAGGTTGSSDYSYQTNFMGKYTVNMDSGINFAAAIGVDASDYAGLKGFRPEIAVTVRSQTDGTHKNSAGYNFVSDLEVKSYSLDLNGYFDLDTKGKVSPYVGVGAGVAQISVTNYTLDDSTSTLHLQLMGGVSFKANDKMSVFIEGRGERYGTLKIENVSNSAEEEFDISGFGLMAGARFKF